AVIVTGGFCYLNKKPKSISPDVSALKGAQRFAAKHKNDFKDWYEALNPEPHLDDHKDAVRMFEADGVAIRGIYGRNPLGRRLAMVAGIDVVVTISGKQHTEVVVEQALELGVPVLPIPNAGGDSKDLLTKYRKRIAASFEPGALDRCLGKISQSIDNNPE